MRGCRVWWGNGRRPQEELDRAGEQLKAATAMVALRAQELNLLEVGTRTEDLARIEAQVEEAYQAWQLTENGYRAEDIAAAQAARDAAKFALDALRIQLEELKIKSPLDGVVEAMELQPGDLVAPSAPVLSLLDDQHLWVRAYVPQNRVGIQVGERLKVVVDSFPDETSARHRRLRLAAGGVHAQQRADARGAIQAGLPDQGGRGQPRA